MCSTAAGIATGALASPVNEKVASRKPLMTLYAVRPILGIASWSDDLLMDQQDNPRQMIAAPNSWAI